MTEIIKPTITHTSYTTMPSTTPSRGTSRTSALPGTYYNTAIRPIYHTAITLIYLNRGIKAMPPFPMLRSLTWLLNNPSISLPSHLFGTGR